MRKFQTLKLSQFHKEKTCWTENWWSSGIMSNFWGEFFYVLGGKKKFKIFFKNILETALKSYIKWLLQFFFYFVWKSLKKLKKLELSPQNFRYGVLHLLYSGGSLFFQLFSTLKKNIYIKAILCNFSMRLLNCFKKK